MPRTPATKQSPAQSLAKTKTTSPHKIAYIPQSIDLITDAVSEMLATGTSDRSLQHLLLAAIEHTTRRTWKRGFGDDDQNEIRARIDEEIKSKFQLWKQDIIAAWRHHRRETPAAIEVKTITERIRLNARETLEGCLERFLGNATPEEIRFMTEVMNDRASNHYCFPTVPTFEIGLATAFQLQLERDGVYLFVPEWLVERVEKYVDALRAIEDKAVV